MSRRILLLGDVNSIYIKHLIEKDLLREGWSIILLDIYKTERANINYLKTIGVHYCYIVPKLFESVNVLHLQGLWIRLFSLIASMRLFVNYRNIDTINIQYINVYALKIARLMRPITKTIVYSFWGSDLLRQSQRVLKKVYPPYFLYADKITFDSLRMISKFNDLYGDSFNAKLEYIRYGNDNIDRIQKVREQFSKEEIKQKMSFPIEKTIIAIGYNAKMEQQHDRVIQTLGNIDDKVKNNLHIVIPFAYGVSSNSYKNKLESLLIENHFNYTFITDFLPSDTIPLLYLGVDIFIHAQTTDAFSQTLVNYLCAGAKVFQGLWLHTEEIDRYSLPIVEFNTFENLYSHINASLTKRLIKQTDVNNCLFRYENSDEATIRWNRILNGL